MSEVQLPIEYLDSGRIARDKINNSFNKVVADVAGYRPHIENGYWWIGENNTGIKAEGDKAYFRATDEYIQYSKDNENWENLIALEDLKGPKGDPGTDAWLYMTQAQYDALPDSKLTDGVSRMIYDEVGGVLKVLLREYDNILHYNNQDELYADLQFESGLTPVSAFPIGVSVGNVEENDGWEYSGVLLNARTDETYIRRLYADDGKLYFDNGNGIFKAIATTDDISSALSSLRNELSTVAFTGLSSDLNNDAEFTADKVLTSAEYEAMGDVTDSDDKRYFLYTQIN